MSEHICKVQRNLLVICRHNRCDEASVIQPATILLSSCMLPNPNHRHAVLVGLVHDIECLSLIHSDYDHKAPRYKLASVTVVIE